MGDGALRFWTALRQVYGQTREQRCWVHKTANVLNKLPKNLRAHRPYEFGVKVSITTTNRRAKGGRFVLHAKALPGNPYDGHILAEVITETEKLTGREIERAYADKGYRGHDAPKPRRVFLSGQKRGVFGAIKRELRRRSAIEAVIGHMKTEGHMGRNFPKGRSGDQANAVLTAVGYNFRLVLRWLRALFPKILVDLLDALIPPLTPKKIGS